MRTIVSKFGGSSTANAAQFKRILEIVRASPARRWVVLSAPGTDSEHGEKVTALLERCWEARANPKIRADAVEAVVGRYREISEALGVPGFDETAQREIEEALNISRDHTLSRGEYLCALLFSRWSGIQMVDAAQLIRFNGNGTADEAQTYFALRRLSDVPGPTIVPGFYGSDNRGNIHVFPCNGSDITGAVVAAGTNAGLNENWTDVPGLMTADPAVVPEARLIRQVGYRQMRALSRAGARVLHPACLDPVAMAGIPTRLRHTDDPDSFGTLIDEKEDRIVPCIAGNPEIALPDGSPAARLTVFGLNKEMVRDATRFLFPLAVEFSGDETRVCVERPVYSVALRTLHARLIE